MNIFPIHPKNILEYSKDIDLSEETYLLRINMIKQIIKEYIKLYNLNYTQKFIKDLINNNIEIDVNKNGEIILNPLSLSIYYNNKLKKSYYKTIKLKEIDSIAWITMKIANN